MSLLTANWNYLGTNFYKKFEICQMLWNIDLQECTIIAAPFAGPICVLKTETGAFKDQTKTILTIFTAVGDFKNQMSLDGRPVGVGWSKNEELLCVHEKGFLEVFDVHDNTQHQITLDQEIREYKIADARIFRGPLGTGLAILTQNHRFFVYNNINDLKIRRLSTNLSKSPVAWEVLSNDQDTKIVVANEGGEVLMIRSQDNTFAALDLSPGSFGELDATNNEQISAISVSFDGSRVCFLTDVGKLIFASVGSNGIVQVLSQFDTESRIRANQIVWCENGAIAAHWANFILFVDLERNWLKYPTYSSVHMVCEPDCIRVVDSLAQDLIKKVEDFTVEVFKIGSIAGGANLLEASRLFEKQSHQADDYLRLIQEADQMDDAVRQCLDAAGCEFSVPTQKMLLRAASFGKSFCSSESSNGAAKHFVATCRTLKILNAIRAPSVGLPMTGRQLEIAGMNSLIDRLIARRHFLLALRIADYLKIAPEKGENKILTRWAFNKVTGCKPADEEQCASDIAAKLQLHSGVSFSEIANHALLNGRTTLAIKLLDFEQRTSSQVPLLLDLKQYRVALQRAIDSGDTNLVYKVIFKLENFQSPTELMMSIRDYPVAYSLYQKYCRQDNRDKLIRNLNLEDDSVGEGICYLEQSVAEKGVTGDGRRAKISLIASSLDTFRKSRNEFLTSHTEEYLRLLKYQIKLEERFSEKKFFGISVQATMRALLEAKEFKLAEELRKDFKVSEKRFYYLKLEVFAQIDEWMEIEKLSKAKKSPIGYEPFVDVCLVHRRNYEAQKYLPKVRDENRIKYLVKTGNYEDAAKFAVERKDVEALEFIATKCGPTNQLLQNKVRAMVAQLRN